MANIINDRFSMNDGISMETQRPSGLWARTEVIVGHDLKYSELGKSTLGEVLFTGHNTVPIGGVQNLMEYLYGVKGPLTIPTLYDQHGIGYANSDPSTVTYKTPTGNKTLVYDIGREIALFGVGITGTAENTLTEYPVDYRENDITMSKPNSDGTVLTGIQLPFRYTKTQLASEDKKKYYGKKTTATGETAYYLKAFEQEPKIKHIWKSANALETDDDQEEVSISNNDVWNLERADKASSFVEMVIRISTKDLHEYFVANDQADQVRFNCIAIYLGRYKESTNSAGDILDADYQDVTLFSKVNIPLESMKLTKDYYAIYRVYGR